MAVAPKAEALAEVADLAARREQARGARDFAAADALRAQIAGLGWLVTDSPAGFVLTPAAPPEPAPGYRVLPGPGAIPVASAADPARRATVALLVEGWPEDLRECVSALLTHAPPGVVISILDIGNEA